MTFESDTRHGWLIGCWYDRRSELPDDQQATGAFSQQFESCADLIAQTPVMIDEIEPFGHHADGDEHHEQPECPFQSQREPPVVGREEIVENEQANVCHCSFDEILLREDRHQYGQDDLQTGYETEQGLVLHANQWIVRTHFVQADETDEDGILKRSQDEDALMKDVLLSVMVEKVDDVSADLEHACTWIVARRDHRTLNIHMIS